MNWIVKTILFFFIFCFGCNEKQEEKAISIESVGVGLDKVKLSNLNGQSVDLSQYKGKTVFLNFWATWCKPCLQEMPSIKNAMVILKNKEIVFLFASDEAAEQIESFKNKNGYDFNYVKAENMEELGIMALPTTYIFDKNGYLVFNEMGYRKWDDKTNIDLILNSIK